jgi:hypothetical protein
MKGVVGLGSTVNGSDIRFANMPVWQPFAIPSARVVVRHRSRGIYPYSIDLKTGIPARCTRHQKGSHIAGPRLKTGVPQSL